MEENSKESDSHSSTSEELRSSRDSQDKDNPAPSTKEDQTGSPDAHGKENSPVLES